MPLVERVLVTYATYLTLVKSAMSRIDLRSSCERHELGRQRERERECVDNLDL